MCAAMVAANDNVRQFYVYQHRRNDSGETFYVGKGTGGRAWTHHGRNQHWHHVVNKHGHSVELLCTDIDEDFAILLECELIAKLGRRDLETGPLVNMTAGGDGASGLVHGSEVRSRISAAKIGRKFSAESRARMSAAKKGQNIGRKHDPETILKIKASQIGRVITDEHRARIGLASRMCGPHTNNSSGYKGVFYLRKTEKWRASIKSEDRRQYIGTFATAEEAARAYDAAAIAAWGAGNCYLNFPAEHLQAA